ncbi:MAG: hypothetical protein QOD42_2003 [Sphingomonadales bacterium]|jgi:hypothetical protein|nr:hypothetical protein [Sphingomonadales bacterium]
MIDYSEDQFRDLCRGRVGGEIGGMEQKRASALRHFWLVLVVGLVLSGLAAGWAIAAGQLVAGVIGASVLVMAAMGLAAWPLGRVSRDLKLPFLEALARKGGMTYVAHGFEPPVYAEAKDALFGSWLTTQTFTDLFSGIDADGRRFAIYEATLSRQSGKSLVIVFSGQIYAFQRRARAAGRIVVVPDRGIFNFFKPQRGMDRVACAGDPDFEKKFEVYAAEPSAAQLLLGSEARRKFLEWRLGGKVLAYIGPEDVLVAISGKNRFEVGSLFRAKPGQERVRTMFDEVRASLATLRSVKAALD